MEEEREAPKADKTDYAVAKYLHEHMAKRIGDLHGMEVDCFFAEEAVNTLLDSPWATGKDVIFTDRHSVVDFCHAMLCKEMFHRAVLAKRKPKPTVAKLTDGNDTPGESGNEGKKSKKKVKDEEKTKTDEADTDKPKKVKKLKLEMPEEQYFDDGREVFVWIYEPVSWKKFMIGFLILFGAVALCCYPLWPEWMRLGVYYLSLGGAGFLGVIISLAILRYIVWGIVYGLTFGQHSFFMFPNLTEDCGFFESFVPLYEYSQPTLDDKNNKKSKKNKDKTAEADVKSDDGTAKSTPDAAGDGSEGEGSEKGSEKGSQSSEDFEVIQKSELSS